MNKMQMIIGRRQKALALFVVIVLCIGFALVVTSLQILAIPPDTSIILSSSQTPTVGPGLGTPTAVELYLTALANLNKWRNNDAFLQGTLTPLDSTSTIISYTRKHEDQIFIVVLNNSAANQSIVINLGSRWISCSSVKNIWVENDPNIWLNHPGSGIDSLSVKLEAWETKIMQCEQETSSLAVDHSISNLFAEKVYFQAPLWL